MTVTYSILIGNFLFYLRELNLVDNNLSGSILKIASKPQSAISSTNTTTTTASNNNSVVIDLNSSKVKIKIPSIKK